MFCVHAKCEQITSTGAEFYPSCAYVNDVFRTVLFLVHYNSLHFQVEAFMLERVDAVACAMKGKMDNAVEYMIETFHGNSAMLFVAPRPAKEGSLIPARLVVPRHT